VSLGGRVRAGAAARASVLWLAAGVLLAGATVLAFFTGGYFSDAQAWAGLAAWVLVIVAVALEPAALPRRRGAWLAVGGLGLFGGWTLLSMAWAPVAGDAYHAGQLVFLYLGVLLASILLLRGAGVQRAVEPGLAAGTLIVIGYGIAGRLLPGLLHFARSISAQGRLEQPLTYWNATGELAALGVVLCCRLAGDGQRPAALRASGAAGGVILGLGVYLSFSRGALFACAAGVVTLVVAAPRREQLEAIGLTIGAGTVASAVSSPFGGVTSLSGSLAAREGQGAIVLAALALIAVGTALGQWRLARRRRDAPLALPRHPARLATVLVCGGLALALVLGAKEGTSASLGGGAGRYVTLQSNRYQYWRVALRAFAQEPIRGVGAGGWAVWWLRYRRIDDFARDAHSLPLQTLAELGLVGGALLGAFVVGVGLAARAAHRAAPGLAAGSIAALVTYAAHAPLDWDWQMPAVTIVAIVLAGQLLAQSDSAIRGASRPKVHTAITHTAA
jgi:hypothetical protein